MLMYPKLTAQDRDKGQALKGSEQTKRLSDVYHFKQLRTFSHSQPTILESNRIGSYFYVKRKRK